MNNEPVAWFEQDENMKSIWYQTDKDAPNAIPLYTHPAKTLTDDPLVNFKPVWQEKPELTLTDEEMYQLASECGFNVDGKAINDGIETAADFHNELIDFARAILRKAQENG